MTEILAFRVARSPECFRFNVRRAQSRVPLIVVVRQEWPNVVFVANILIDEPRRFGMAQFASQLTLLSDARLDEV